MASLRWTYRIRSQLEETKENATKKGFEAFWLFGTSKTGNEFPLNQLKIKGGELSPKIRIQVSPNSTQLYYYVKGIISVDDLGTILSEKEDAERILNDLIIFMPDEISRFSLKTAVPVESLAMLKLEYRLKELSNENLETYRDIAFKQAIGDLITGVRGNIPQAKVSLENLIGSVSSFAKRLIHESKESGNPDAAILEHDLNEVLTAPIGELLRKEKKIDLNPRVGEFKE